MTDGSDGLAALAGVGAFLAEQIVPAVPDELASEVRAAVKLLETAATELNQRHPLLLAELTDSLGYCRRTARLLDRPISSFAWLRECQTLARRAEEPGLDLRGLDSIYHRVRALSSTLLIELRNHQSDPATPDVAKAKAGELAAQFCACLGDHGRRRRAWQAVFPVSPDTPRSTGATDE